MCFEEKIPGKNRGCMHIFLTRKAVYFWVRTELCLTDFRGGLEGWGYRKAETPQGNNGVSGKGRGSIRTSREREGKGLSGDPCNRRVYGNRYGKSRGLEIPREKLDGRRNLFLAVW